VYSDRRERLNLTNYKICNLVCRQLQITTAKIFTVVEARMRTNRYTEIAGQQYGVAHDCRTSGMTTTCDVS